MLIKSKKAKTVIFVIFLFSIVVIMSFLIIPKLVSPYILGPGETIFLDWKVHNESNLSINAIAEYHCDWNNPSDVNKTCSPIIEIMNNGTDTVKIDNVAMTSDFTALASQSCINTVDSSLFNKSVINWSCVNYSAYMFEENCTVNVTRINWGNDDFLCTDSPTVEIGPGNIIAIKLNWEMGVYDGGSYNFSFKENRTNKTINLDPLISNCSVINGSGYYNITADLSGRNCLVINASDVSVNGFGHTLTFASGGSGWGVLIGGDNNGDNFTLNNLSIVQAASNSESCRGISANSVSYPNVLLTNVFITTNYRYSTGISFPSVYSSAYNNISIINSSVHLNYGHYAGSTLLDLENLNNSLIKNVSLYSDNGADDVYGIYFSGSNLTNLTDIDIELVDVNSINIALILDNSNNNIINGSSFITHRSGSGTDEKALYFMEANNQNIFRDSSFTRVGGSGSVIHSESGSSGTQNFTNIYMPDGISTPSGTTKFNVGWWVDVYVNDSAGNNLASANVTLKNNAGTITNWSLTNSNGYIVRLEPTQYLLQSSGSTYYTNYTFNGTKSGYLSDQKSRNITTNFIDSDKIFLTLTAQIPTISFISPTPSNNEFRNYNWSAINISSDFDLFNATLTWNGLNYSMSNSSLKLFGTNKTSLVDAPYTYKVYGNTTGGIMNVSATQLVTIDTRNPDINFSSPTQGNNTWTTSTSYIVNISVNDTNLNTTSPSATIKFNNSQSTMTCPTGTKVNCTYTKNLSQGLYIYNATILDKATNSNITENRWIKVDSFSPSLSNIFPAVGTTTYTDKNYANVTFTLNETNPSYIYLNWNGDNQSLSIGVDCTGTNPIYTCVKNETTLSNGLYTVSIWANDSAGNAIVSSGSRQFNISIPSPTISYVSPALNNTFIKINYFIVNISSTMAIDTCLFDNGLSKQFISLVWSIG